MASDFAGYRANFVGSHDCPQWCVVRRRSYPAYGDTLEACHSTHHPGLLMRTQPSGWSVEPIVRDPVHGYDCVGRCNVLQQTEE
jgi:hypothetical protein